MNNEPVAIRYDFDGYGYQYMDSGSGSDWLTRVDGELLYTRPTDAQIRKYIQVLESIANEQVELSHDKIKWQNGDHIRWAKEALK
jgi:proline racemase